MKIYNSLFSHFIFYRLPRNLTSTYSLGSIMAVLFIAQILSGLFLIMFYIPNTDMAFNSVSFIIRDVPGGWFVRYLHMNGSSFLFFLLYLHIGKGLFYSTYTWSSRLTWWSGYFLFLMNTIISFLGYILPWGQMSFWGLTVITNLVTCLPVVGDRLLLYLWGGFEISTITLQRVFVLHYFLPFVLLAGIVAHVLSMHESSVNNPYGHNQKIINDIKDIPLYPYYLVKDYYYFWVFILIFSFIIFFCPEKFSNPVNYIEANPMKTPKHIIPEWYFLPFYSILKVIPSKVTGVLTMLIFIVHPFYIPYFNSMNTPNKYRFYYTFIFRLVKNLQHIFFYLYRSTLKYRIFFENSVYGNYLYVVFCSYVYIIIDNHATLLFTEIINPLYCFMYGGSVINLIGIGLAGVKKELINIKNRFLGQAPSLLSSKENFGVANIYMYIASYYYNYVPVALYYSIPLFLFWLYLFDPVLTKSFIYFNSKFFTWYFYIKLEQLYFIFYCYNRRAIHIITTMLPRKLDGQFLDIKFLLKLSSLLFSILQKPFFVNFKKYFDFIFFCILIKVLIQGTYLLGDPLIVLVLCYKHKEVVAYNREFFRFYLTLRKLFSNSRCDFMVKLSFILLIGVRLLYKNPYWLDFFYKNPYWLDFFYKNPYAQISRYLEVFGDYWTGACLTLNILVYNFYTNSPLVDFCGAIIILCWIIGYEKTKAKSPRNFFFYSFMKYCIILHILKVLFTELLASFLADLEIPFIKEVMDLVFGIVDIEYWIYYYTDIYTSKDFWVYCYNIDYIDIYTSNKDLWVYSYIDYIDIYTSENFWAYIILLHIIMAEFIVKKPSSLFGYLAVLCCFYILFPFFPYKGCLEFILDLLIYDFYCFSALLCSFVLYFCNFIINLGGYFCLVLYYLKHPPKKYDPIEDGFLFVVLVGFLLDDLGETAIKRVVKFMGEDYFDDDTLLRLYVCIFVCIVCCLLRWCPEEPSPEIRNLIKFFRLRFTICPFIIANRLTEAFYKFFTVRLKKQNSIKNRYKILFFFSISNFLLLTDTGYWEVSSHISNHYFKFFSLFLCSVICLIGYQKGSSNNYK